MQEIEEIVEGLQDLGFSNYEAKVLAAMFVLGPSTAREIAETSGVPRPKVYEILRGLSEKGIVELQYGKPMIYVPIDPKAFVERLERKYQGALNSLKRSFEKIRREGFTKRIYTSTIIGERGTLSKFREVLLRARREAYIILRDPGLIEEIREVLKVCLDKRVRVVLFLTFHDREVLSELKSLGVEVRSVQKVREENPAVSAILDIVEEERLIAAANIDSNGIYFIFTENTLVGVWIGIKVLARIQTIMLKRFFEIGLSL